MQKKGPGRCAATVAGAAKPSLPLRCRSCPISTPSSPRLDALPLLVRHDVLLVPAQEHPEVRRGWDCNKLLFFQHGRHGTGVKQTQRCGLSGQVRSGQGTVDYCNASSSPSLGASEPVLQDSLHHLFVCVCSCFCGKKRVTAAAALGGLARVRRARGNIRLWKKRIVGGGGVVWCGVVGRGEDYAPRVGVGEALMVVAPLEITKVERDKVNIRSGLSFSSSPPDVMYFQLRHFMNK